MRDNCKILGAYGERMAKAYLLQKGLEIVECNFRCRFGEIDIIALDKEILVFVEVKTRVSVRKGSPEEAITFLKRRRLQRLALVYLSRLGREVPCRFDVITITKEKGKDILKHWENAI